MTGEYIVGKLIVFIIIALLALGVVYYLMRLYQKLTSLRHDTEKAFENIDGLLKQRADEIPELVSLLETSAGFQSSLFQQLLKQRKRYQTSRKSEDKVRLANQIAQGIQQIFTLSEAYPELKSLYGLVELRKRLAQLEPKIAERAEPFNQRVIRYNAGIHSFPNAILALLLGYRTKSLLAQLQEERDDRIF